MQDILGTVSLWKRAWVTSSIVVLGCAGGADRATTTAASVGDAGTATTSSATTSGSATDGTTEGIGGTTTALDSTGTADSMPTDSTDAIPTECDEDPAACTVWLLPSGSDQWIPLALDSESTLVPTDAVRAAFDIESELEGFVLTDTRLHVVDLAARQWVRTNDRNDALPELGNDEILVAYTVPSEWGAMFGGDPNLESVTFISATTAYLYDYEIDARAFSFSMSTTRFGPEWGAPAAPSPNTLRAAWLDVTNEPGWFQADIMQLCGMMGPPGPYVGFIAAGEVHLQDAGYCFEFADPVGLDAFDPFTLPGAPVAADIEAALYNETMGLWVFRG
jgi:hypothetical protein